MARLTMNWQASELATSAAGQWSQHEGVRSLAKHLQVG